MQLVTFSWSQSPLTIRILPMEDFPGGSDGKASVYNAGDLGLIPEDPRKETATHSSTLAWKIPWTEEPGRLQSMGSLRVGHGWATSLQTSYALSVLYKWNNNKAWKTQAHLFTTWFPEYFRPTVYCPGKKKKFLSKYQCSLTKQLVTQELWRTYTRRHIIFIPVNIISILQPMDQGIIFTFKFYLLFNKYIL